MKAVHDLHSMKENGKEKKDKCIYCAYDMGDINTHELVFCPQLDHEGTERGNRSFFAIIRERKK